MRVGRNEFIMKAETKKSIIKLILSGLVIGAVVLGVYFLMKHFGLTELTREQLGDYIQSFGVIGPIVFIVVTFLQVTFIPLPGAVTILAGNYVFGAFASFIYSYIGMILGSAFAFLLGRKIGKPFVNWVAGDEKKVDDWLKKLKGRENVLLFFMFFLPLFPDDVLCAIAGILPISWWGFMLMQIVTRLTSIGGTLLFMSGEVIPYEGWGLVFLGVGIALCIVAFIIAFKNAEKINLWFENFIDKHFKRKKVEKEE